MNKKIIIILCMIVVLFVFEFLTFYKWIYPFEAYGIIAFLLLINPSFAIIINLMVGKDIKKYCYIPLAFSLIFLLTYFIIGMAIFKVVVILEFLLFAIIYLILGIISMFISYFVYYMISKIKLKKHID